MTYAAALLHEKDDRAGLQALWGEVMNNRSSQSIADWRFAWFFEQNPAGAPATCVTHHLESKELVACASAYARRTQVAGELHSAGILSDFAVSKPHRVAGAALAVQRRLMAESLQRFSFVHGCPNQVAEAIFKRLGYRAVAATADYSRPLRTAKKLGPYLKSPLAARVAGALVDAALAVSDLRGWLRRPFAWRSERLLRADERFDALWARARRHYGITGERSAAYLNWRYADFKTARYRFFCLSERRSGALVGYVVYVEDQGVVCVADLFCDEPRTLFATLLLRFVAAMRDGDNHAVYLSIVADRSIEQALRRALFIKRPGSKQLIARARDGAPAALWQELTDAQRWFLVGGELDT